MVRLPALTPRGRLVLATSGALLVAGAIAGAWSLAGLGVALSTLLSAAYLAFVPSAAMLWRRHVEMSWSVPRTTDGGLIAGRPFTLQVTLRNRGPLGLGHARIRVLASSGIEPPRAPPADGDALHLELTLGARAEATVTGEGRALAAGTWFLHGAAVTIGDPLGVAALEAYFPSPLALQVLPRPVGGAAPPPLRAAGASDERAGNHALRLPGPGGELRELREHVPGDPFKQIAWKATARTGRLMVRDLDRETLATHWLLVDLAATMRDGAPGTTRLDRAIELAAAYARAALDGGDRVGLVTFDGRVHATVPPGDGPVQRLRIIERLLDSMHAVEEELTDLTDGELVAAVARYLRHQESFDARLPAPPPIDDPAWSHIVTGPTGELYDLAAIGKVATRILDGEAASRARRRTTQAAGLATDPEMARLRLLSRARGIELPLRRAVIAGRRARGLADALEVAARSRGAERIVILSDLEGLDGDLAPLARCVALARRRGHRLACLLPPVAPAPAVDPDLRNERSFRTLPPGMNVHSDRGETSAAVAEIFAWERRRRERAAARRLAALGVSVLRGPFGAPTARGAGLTPRGI